MSSSGHDRAAETQHYRRNRAIMILLAVAFCCGIQIRREQSGMGYFVPEDRYIKKVVRRPSKATTHRIPRLINDITLDWNETMHRPWLSATSQDEQPPYMILLSNTGWNHPNQTYGLTFGRSIRERELFQAIVNHPYFHPTGWEDIRNGSMPISSSTKYYVFVDRMQCGESNYPLYGGGTDDNKDVFHNRSLVRFKPYCSWKIPDILQHPLFEHENNTAKHNSTAVMFNCQGNGPGRRDCAKAAFLPVSVASLSGHFPRVHIDKDQGLIAPAVTSIRLSEMEEASIANCQADMDPRTRPLKVAYIGNYRNGHNSDFNKAHGGGARGSYRPFHRPEEGFWIQHRQDFDTIVNDNVTISININNETIHKFEKPTYTEIMQSTKFALVARGDNKFSYRFTEALSAGAIPVFHGDDHMLPFRPEVVDWNRCALVLPEKDAGQTAIDLMEEYLANRTEEMCAMRQYCYFGIYKKYVETSTGTITGLLDGLEALARGERKTHAGFFCNETSVENLECNPMRR